MYINETFKGRIRIEGKPDAFTGYKMSIHDLDTGEQITNVIGAAIYLAPGELNVAELTYHRYLAQGCNFMELDEQGNPVPEKIRIDNPEIAVSAFERTEQQKEEDDDHSHGF